jgi:hypothetical protein
MCLSSEVKYDKLVLHQRISKVGEEGQWVTVKQNLSLKIFANLKAANKQSEQEMNFN